MEKLELSVTGPVSDTQIAEPRFVPARHEIKRRLLLGRKAMTNRESILKRRDVIFADKGPSSQSYGFSSSHVWM